MSEKSESAIRDLLSAVPRDTIDALLEACITAYEVLEDGDPEHEDQYVVLSESARQLLDLLQLVDREAPAKGPES